METAVLVRHNYDYRTGNPAVYVGTYGKYVNGSLYGEWIDLTTFYDYEEFLEFCRELHDDEFEPEFMYQDYENFPEAWYCESGMDEETFNKIVRYGELTEDEKRMWDAYTNLFGDGDMDDMEDRFVGKYDDEEDFAYNFYLECNPGVEDNPLFIYVDWKQVARDLMVENYMCDGYFFRA